MTGGSGFIAGHCIVKCLAAGYRVRTTLRSIKREAAVREMLRRGNGDSSSSDLDRRLSFVEVDLGRDEGWDEAAWCCTFVLHVASPFPAGPPKHPDDLVKPARDGTLRVLRAAEAAGVSRVVVTSSIAAVVAGHEGYDAAKIFTEDDWSNSESPFIDAYAKSKTLAKRAAWDYVKIRENDNNSSNGGGRRQLELAVVNPGLVLGPVFGANHSTSIEVVSRLMNGAIPGCPRLICSIVDVRDVADLHLLAMRAAGARGQRYIGSSPPSPSIQDISRILHEKMGMTARRVPTRELPDFLVRVASWFDPAIRLIVNDLGRDGKLSIDKTRDWLDWTPRPAAESVVDTAQSLVDLGLVKR